MGTVTLPLRCVSAEDFPGWWRLQLGPNHPDLPLHLAQYMCQSLLTDTSEFEWPTIAAEAAEVVAGEEERDVVMTVMHWDEPRVAAMVFRGGIAWGPTSDSRGVPGLEYKGEQTMKRDEVMLRCMKDTLRLAKDTQPPPC